jgi:hypothetical protein
MNQLRRQDRANSLTGCLSKTNKIVKFMISSTYPPKRRGHHRYGPLLFVFVALYTVLYPVLGTFAVIP